MGRYYILPGMKKAFYVLLILVVLLTWRNWTRREIVHPPGVLVPQAPRQVAVAEFAYFVHRGFRLTPRAELDIRARVLSREDYRFGKESELSPMDLALGWGVMSDQAVLDRIQVSQGARWYFTRDEYPQPVPDRAIINNSGNMHMIPASDAVLGRLREIRNGDVVRLRGFLVDVDEDSGFQWRTSLRRDDTGNGSCEIFFVERIQIGTRP